MNLKDFELAVSSYCETTLAPQIDKDYDKFLFYAGLAAIGLKFEEAMQSIAPAISQLGLIGADGEINLGLLEQIGTAAFAKQPTVKLMKFTFTAEDFSGLMRHLRQG